MIAGKTALYTCLVILLLATITDLAKRKIPNGITLTGIALGIGLHAAIGWVDGGAMGILHGVGRALLAVVVCSVVPLISFLRGEMGGGDVKLFAAVAALCGPFVGIDTEAFAFLFSFVFVLPWQLWRKNLLRHGLVNLATRTANLFRPAARKRPYVAIKLRPAIFAPTILVGFALALAREGEILIR